MEKCCPSDMYVVVSGRCLYVMTGFGRLSLDFIHITLGTLSSAVVLLDVEQFHEQS